jgi:hypothetical protein
MLAAEPLVYSCFRWCPSWSIIAQRWNWNPHLCIQITRDLSAFEFLTPLSRIYLKKLADVSWSTNFPAFYGTRKSLSCSPGPATVPGQRQMNLVHIRPSCFIKAILILFSPPCIGVASCPFASDVSSKTLSPFPQACYVTCAPGAFGNCEKQLISFVMSALLSCRIQHLGSHETDLHEISYKNIFRKTVEKIQVSFKSDKNNRYFTWRHTHTHTYIYIYIKFWSYLAQFVLEREMFQTKDEGKIKTHFMFNSLFSKIVSFVR